MVLASGSWSCGCLGPKSRQLPSGLSACQVCLHFFFCNSFIDSVRTVRPANVKLSDKELFANMPLGDPWADANLAECVEYMHEHPHTVIPDSWMNTMKKFRQDLLYASTSDASLVERYNSLVAAS